MSTIPKRRTGPRGQNSELAGVYALTCLATGKAYIGSSIRLRTRIHQHMKSLKAGNHHSNKFQNAYNKYGPSSFSLSILESIRKDMPDLRERILAAEQYWIDAFDACKSGLNTAPIAGSTLGMLKTDAEKKKISEFHRKRYRVISPDGKVFDVFGLSPFCKQHNLNSGAMSQVARGKHPHHKGWRVEKWDEPFSLIHWGQSIEAERDWQGEPMGSLPCRFRFIHRNGAVKIGNNLTSFAKAHGIKPKSLSATVVQTNGQYWAGDWRCERCNKPNIIPEPIIYVVQTPTGEEIETENLAQFCRDFGLSRSKLHGVVKGHNEHHRQYRAWIKGNKVSFKAFAVEAKQYWIITSPEGVVSRIDEITPFCRKHGLTAANMYQVAKGASKHHKGWQCVRVEAPVVAT